MITKAIQLKIAFSFELNEPNQKKFNRECFNAIFKLQKNVFKVIIFEVLFRSTEEI
jgi:hypothetical protein